MCPFKRPSGFGCSRVMIYALLIASRFPTMSDVCMSVGGYCSLKSSELDIPKILFHI